MVAPTVDPQTRNAIVYVDLPKAARRARRACSRAASSSSARKRRSPCRRPRCVHARRLQLRLHGIEPDGKVTQVKVSTGRRVGDRVEIIGGLEPDARVVASGAAFLADGDLVRIVEPADGGSAKST